MNKEEKIFEENMDKLNRMIEDFTIEDASSYLIASGLFKDEDELFFYLNQYPTTRLALQGIHDKECVLHGFDQVFALRDKYMILEPLIDKIVVSDKIKHTYLDTVSIKYNVFTFKYTYIESNWYLAKVYIEDILDEIKDTVRFFGISKVEELGDLFVKDAITYYFDYISKYAIENKRDKEILERIANLFKDETIPEFSNIEKRHIDFLMLSSYMNEVNPMNPCSYDVDKEEFMNDYYAEDIDEEDEFIDLEFEVYDVLKRFIQKMPFDLVEKENIYELLYGMKPFKRCKEAFRRCGVMNMFNSYEEAEAILNSYGWCINNHFTFSFSEHDWLKLLNPFKD